MGVRSDHTRSSGGGAGLLEIGHLAADLLHKDGQVIELVLVDAEHGHAGQVGQLDVGRVLVPIQDQRAELLQLAQPSRVPVTTE